MNMARYNQFLLESKILEDSSMLATMNAHRLNTIYESLSEEELAFQAPQLLADMEYWEGRLMLEDRILTAHIKYNIKEVRGSIKSIESLSGDCLEKQPDQEMMRAILYKINQLAHKTLHNIDHYGIR